MKDPLLRDDPPAREPFGLPVEEHRRHLSPVHSGNHSETGAALAQIRAAAGDAFLVGEVYLPSAQVRPYLEHFDRFFAFEVLHGSWDADVMRSAIDGALGAAVREGTGPAWVLSNHDFGRIASRFGRQRERAALLLLLTLPGTAFLYQGDEIGQADGPGADPPYDRAGRDGYRHPMQWDASPRGGFTDGEPWLPLVDPHERSVEAQRGDPGSTLSYVRELIALRRGLAPEFEWLDAPEGVLAFTRGDRTVAINMTDEPAPGPGDRVLAPHEGAIS
jgi:alpha-glucosidase